VSFKKENTFKSSKDSLVKEIIHQYLNQNDIIRKDFINIKTKNFSLKKKEKKKNSAF